MTPLRCFASFTIIAFAAALPARAHITLETPQAAAGTYYKAVFRIGHGCAGSPITELVVQIPAGVQNARPMPKPGWQLTIEKAALAQPYVSHGKTISDDVSSLRWSGGNLPEAWYDEFIVFVKLPERPGALYWKVSQICDAGRIDWVDTPVAGKPLADSKTPAVVLELTPPEDQTGHHH